MYQNPIYVLVLVSPLVHIGGHALIILTKKHAAQPAYRLRGHRPAGADTGAAKDRDLAARVCAPSQGQLCCRCLTEGVRAPSTRGLRDYRKKSEDLRAAHEELHDHCRSNGMSSA